MTTWTGYVSEQPFAVSQKAKGAAIANRLELKQEIPERSVVATGKKDFESTGMLLWGIFALPVFWILSSFLVIALITGGTNWWSVFLVWAGVYWIVPLLLYLIKAKESKLQVTIQKRSAGSFVTIMAEGISGNMALGMLVMGLNTNVGIGKQNSGPSGSNQGPTTGTVIGSAYGVYQGSSQ